MPDAERQALVNLYNSTNGAEWYDNTNWLTGDPCENGWYEVTCDSAKEHVTDLMLYENGLAGQLPDLSPLSRLEYFSASGNNLSGPIPALPDSLEYFYATDNNLSGQIPALPDSLVEFYVDGNNLSGPIPALPDSLSWFNASDNNLTGQIPALPDSLRVFFASNNFLSGSIRDNNPVLSGFLQTFIVDGNFLTGLPPAPNHVLKAAMCPNRLDSPGTPGAPDWPASLFPDSTTKWTDDCAPATSATVQVDNTAQGGSIACDTPVPYAAGGSCTATPDAGYAFARELVFDPVDAAAVQECTDTGCTILVKRDVTVRAVFTKATGQTPTTPTPDPTPTADPTPAPSYHHNSSPTLGELGLALASIALAGAAAPAVRRREKQGKKSDTRQ